MISVLIAGFLISKVVLILLWKSCSKFLKKNNEKLLSQQVFSILFATFVHYKKLY